MPGQSCLWGKMEIRSKWVNAGLSFLWGKMEIRLEEDESKLLPGQSCLRGKTEIRSKWVNTHCQLGRREIRFE